MHKLSHCFDLNCGISSVTLDCVYEEDPPFRKKRGHVPDTCFDRCSLNPDGKARRFTLFASQFPVSEYRDNICRIGQMLMDLNVNCHEICKRTACKHKFTVDWSLDPAKKRRCKYEKCESTYSGWKSKFQTKTSHDFTRKC